MRANTNQIGMIFIVIGMLIYSFHDLAVKMIANETTIFQLFITRAFVGVIVTLTCLKYLDYKILVIPVYPKLTLIRCVLMHFGFFIRIREHENGDGPISAALSSILHKM